MSLKHDLQKLADQTGGRATRSARRTTAKQLAEFSGQYGIKDIRQIKPKTISRFIDSMRDGNSIRSLQNKMSHIREILRESGRSQLADEKIISNESLGIAGGSRIGTHEAIPDDKFSELIEKLPEDVRVTAELQRTFGLRLSEAVGIGNKDVLKRVERDLERDFVHIYEQTKGHRPRDTSFSSKQYGEAREVVTKALKYLTDNRREYIIQGKAGTFESAKNRYSNMMRRAGFTGKISTHSMRYSWAQERLESYFRDSYDRREARALVAGDLGHGPGRGRWIASVYAQK